MTEPTAIGHVALIFKLNNEMVVRSFEGVTGESYWRQPHGGGNPLGWLLGHVTISRAQLLTALEQPWNPGLGAHFDRGSTFVEPSQYPPREVLEAAWKETRTLMRNAFAALSDEALRASPSSRSFPGVRSLADLIAFYAFHESYHVGQMGYVRRLLGHSSIAG